MKFLSGLIPQSMQEQLLRNVISTKDVTSNPNLEVRLASSFDDYRRAFILLHECYVAKGYMEEHPSKMRCNVHSFLPHNRVIVAVDKSSNEVIGTVSLIMDNQMGIPADIAYPQEVNEIRKSRIGKILEVSALAVDSRYRHQSHSIQFMLNKFLYLYSRNVLSVKVLVIVIHPKAEIFYRSLMGFKALGDIIAYKFVKGALARLMYLDISEGYETNLSKLYIKKKKTFASYVFRDEDKRLKIIDEISDDVIKRNAITMIELIKSSHFEMNSLSEIQKSHLISGLNFSKLDLENLNFGFDDGFISKYRFEVNFLANLTHGTHESLKKIINLSEYGAFIESEISSIAINQSGSIQFRWKGKVFKSEYQIAWINHQTANKLPIGFGVRFISKKVEIFTEVSKGQAA